MQAPGTATQWMKHWLYDWSGANVDLFLGIQRTLPDGWIWLPEFLSAVGSYWGAPAVVVLFLVWGHISVRRAAIPSRVALWRFTLGLPLSFAAAALTKTWFALPRPFVLLGDSMYRAASAPDSRYTMPSGHAVYMGVLTASLWPVLGRTGRIGVLLFAVAVGWSRIVLGAHFPVDVIAGFALGWACVAVVGPWARDALRRACHSRELCDEARLSRGAGRGQRHRLGQPATRLCGYPSCLSRYREHAASPGAGDRSGNRERFAARSRQASTEPEFSEQEKK